MWIAGRGYKAGRFTYFGNAALPPPPDTGTDTDTFLNLRLHTPTESAHCIHQKRIEGD
jgi:hypothetical protein